MKTRQDIYEEMCGACPHARKCRDEAEGCKKYEDAMLKFDMVERFQVMDEEDQKLFLFMCVDAYFELCDKWDKEKTKSRKALIQVQIDTYSMIINLFNTPAPELVRIGYDNRQILHTYIKQKLDEFLGEEKLSEC